MSITQIMVKIPQITVDITQPIASLDHLIVEVRGSILSITQPITAVSHSIMNIANKIIKLRQQNHGYRPNTRQQTTNFD